MTHAGLQTIAMATELSARRKQDRWDRHFLRLAFEHARMSKALDIGRLEIDEATKKFVTCWETFGTDPWVDVADIDTYDDLEFPAYLAAA